MIYLICWLIIPTLWMAGGQGKIPPLYRYWRKALVPVLLALIVFPTIKLWSILLAGLSFGSLSLPYGDEKTDLPRWLCGILYVLPLALVAYFTEKWFLFGLQVIISTVMGEWVNNWLNFRIKWHADRITEFLTAFFSYCLIPFVL